MAHQDYVARPRATKKKNNPYKPKRKQTAPKSGLKPILIIGLILLIVAGFGYFLYVISHNDNKVEVTEITLSSAKSAKDIDEDPLPEPPKEAWSYVEGLKHKKVEVETYEVEEKGPYKLQCASFRNQQDANELKANIAFGVGLSSEVRPSNGSNGVWYKVILGPYKNKRLAEKDRHRLRNSKINGCLIYPWT
ncbi:SPOR domain-containing protein [Thalassotalea aquiviva]|uniref:SPOR domain-containing protein n=1 Tax=Thalassotalea aquiviva TaxID=3242415 RepID=UPI00352B849C